MPRSVSEQLIDWYRVHKRDLPWRKTSDPYAVLVSEVMLQQTQVATVMPYYDRFLSLFPTVNDLAGATEERAMAAWAGLGYYRRLRNLQAAARSISVHGWPSNLQDLPGVGEYTAAALGSIAFGNPVACADGNVRRVMSRLCGKTLTISEAQRASQPMMPSRAGEWNQAVMELGALICTSHPRCDSCPVQHRCAAFRKGLQAAVPLTVRRPTERIDHVCVCIVKDSKVALRPAGPDEWWQGMLVFPFARVSPRESHMRAAAKLGLTLPRPLCSVKHTVTKHRVTLSAYVGDGYIPNARWHAIDDLAELPLPAPQRRVAKALEQAA